MKARVMFDTLAYANRLKAVGLESKIAEEHAEANADMIANLFNETIVTKQDLQLSERAVRDDVHEFRQELKKEIDELRQELRSSIQELRNEMKLMESRIETRLTIRLGIMNVACLSVFMGLMSAFHFIH